MSEKQSYSKIRSGFPQVYRTPDGFMVSARSRRWGLDIRKTFPTEAEALAFREQIQKQIETQSPQTDIPKEKIVSATAYEKLIEKLTRFNKTPEDAVEHYIKFLGNEITRQAMPTVGKLVDDWQAHKFLDTTIDEQYRNEIKLHCRFIKRRWGEFRADEIRKNDIEVTLKKHPGTNNTRRKYLTFVRMFFKWVIAEDKGYVLTNPTMGIKFKAERFEKGFYQPEDLKMFFQKVAEKFPELVGYYTVLTFCGLRPSEGARIQWHHVNFKTNELHVIKGKTDARHIHLEPVAVAWLQWHKENLAKDALFVPKKNMFNLEREARGILNGEWIPDGLRHTFATYYTSLKKDYPAVAWYMGNSVAMIKKHYAQTIPGEPLNEFWTLTPEKVLEKKITHKTIP